MLCFMPLGNLSASISQGEQIMSDILEKAAAHASRPSPQKKMMKAAIFVENGRIVLDEKPVPDVGPLDALIRVTTTTICGTDIHILKGEYPVAKGLTIGHEPVGIIEKLGSPSRGSRKASASLPAPSPLRATPMPVCAGAARRMARAPSMVSRLPAAGALATRLMAPRPNISWCRMPWPIWPSCRKR